MAHRTVLVLVALCAAAFGAGALRHREPPRDPPFSHPYVQWIGHDSKVARESFVLVRDEPTWRPLWASHAGLSEFRNAIPLVDFSQCAVVAFFRGPSTNEDGEKLESITTEPGRVVLRFVPSTFQTASGLDGAGGGAVKTSPFGIWVIPATDKAVVVEEGRMHLGLKAEEIEWKEVHRFDPR